MAVRLLGGRPETPYWLPGVGDMFVTLAQVLDEAVMTAAITCTRRGADPPSAAELQARLR
jgi:sugar/nucleoside kinase (ribokinase family)